jgi:FkbM family methyltransferase
MERPSLSGNCQSRPTRGLRTARYSRVDHQVLGINKGRNMKASKLERISNYVRHIAFCFKNTRDGNYLRTLRIAAAYLGLHLRLFKSRNKTLAIRLNDFDMDLNIYSREVAGYWEIFLEHQYLELPAKKDQKVVVLDIGANVGFFAIKQALQFKENLKLIAFEPDPGTYQRLRANVGRINSKVSSQINCYNSAIDTYIGQAKFLQDVSVESHIVEGDTAAPSITVQVTTLDSVVEKEGIEKIDLMKIDVEGHEMKVLESGKKALSITDNITLEYHAPHFVEEITNLLAPYHFRLVDHNEAKSILSFTKNPGFTHSQVRAQSLPQDATQAVPI